MRGQDGKEGREGKKREGMRGEATSPRSPNHRFDAVSNLLALFIQDKTAYKDYMEANGYRTLKEVHNGQFYAHDFMFVTNKLYESLIRRQIIEEREEDLNQ